MHTSLYWHVLSFLKGEGGGGRLVQNPKNLDKQELKKKRVEGPIRYSRKSYSGGGGGGYTIHVPSAFFKSNLTVYFISLFSLQFLTAQKKKKSGVGGNSTIIQFSIINVDASCLSRLGKVK